MTDRVAKAIETLAVHANVRVMQVERDRLESLKTEKTDIEADVLNARIRKELGLSRKLSDLTRMMNDPIGQINEIFEGANLLRKEQVTPSPYEEAYWILEGSAEYTDFEGEYQLVIPISRAADLIADNYERRDV